MKVFKICINETFEEEQAVVDVSENNKLVLKGDYYHDKISAKIGGFFDGLIYCGVKYKLDKTEYITPNNPLFTQLGFYNDRYEIE